MKTDDKVTVVIDTIFNSQRSIPAHFSSSGDRTQSFLSDFDISAEDEYEIASQVYYIMWEFLSKVPGDQIKQSDASYVLKIGEDIAFGAFMLQKVDEYASFSDLKQQTIKRNVLLFQNEELQKVIDFPLVQNYFDFCQWFGRARANGFSWGKR